MSQAAQGVVTTVEGKPFTDRNSGQPITLWSFQVQGDNSWYRLGQSNPTFQQGQFITFVWDQKGRNKFVDTNSVQVSEAPAQPQPQQQSQAPRNNYSKAASNPQKDYKGKDNYWQEKERHDKEVTQPTINFTAARGHAVQLVATALQHECLSLGQKKADRLGILLDTVDEITRRFCMDSARAPEIIREWDDGLGTTAVNAAAQDNDDGEDFPYDE